MEKQHDKDIGKEGIDFSVPAIMMTITAIMTITFIAMVVYALFKLLV